MNKRKIIIAIVLTIIACLTTSTQVLAQNLDQKGSVQFVPDDGAIVIVDPEKPTDPVDPGEVNPRTGHLTLDYAPQLNFGRNKISDKDASYQVEAQMFYGATKPRPNFVQVSDNRLTGAGWTLQVRQETNFIAQESNDVLKGIYLSFDKVWANSVVDKKYAPVIKNDTIKLDKIGTTYELVTAEKNHGQGTWSIAFGYSDENLNQQSTLSPAKDANGRNLFNTTYNNQISYKNSAITLFVPGSVEKKPVRYQTVLTWVLAELP